MPTTGSYELKLAPKAENGFVPDERIEPDIGPGEWAWIDKSYIFDGRRKFYMVCFRCPDCKFMGTIWRHTAAGGSEGHTIDAEGIVRPSIGCGHNCGFHTQPTKLLGFVDKR